MDFDSLQDDSVSQGENHPVPFDHLIDDHQDQSGVDFDSLQDDHQKYSTPGQLALTAAEGIGRGSTLGLSSGVEQLLGQKPEDIIARQKENPMLSEASEIGGLVGSSLIPGYGEANILAKAGTGLAGLAEAGKIGSMAIRGAVESGLFQGGDEISKAMLGQGDPEAPVSAALSHMGAATLMGSVVGGVFGTASAGLAKLGETKVGQRLGQFGEDFGNRWKYLKENTAPEQAVTEELNNFHNTVLENGSDAFSLKKDVADKLIPKEATPAVDSLMNEISNKISSRLESAGNSVKTRTAVPFISEDLNDWQKVITDPNSSSADKFIATDNLKKTLQGYAKWNGTEEASSKGILGSELSDMVKNSLEDTKVWGDLGKVQKELNSAYSDLVKRNGPLKTISMFMSHEGNGAAKVFDEAKVDTLLKQIEKGSKQATRKNNVLSNYIESMNNYQKVVDSIHDKLGLESPIRPSSLNATKEALGQTPSDGSKFADMLSGHKPSLGGVLPFPLKQISPLIGMAIGRPLNSMAAHAIIKTLGSEAYHAGPEVLNHAAVVDKGAKKIANAVDAIFASSSKALKFEVSEKDRDKLRKFVEDGGVTQQMQNTLNRQKPQRFAEGGMAEIETPLPPEPKSNLSKVYPDQDMLMQTAKGRIYNYLNNQRPQENSARLPFDSKIDDKSKNKDYDNILDLAIQPLSILSAVKDGSLTPSKMQHFTQMYPEVYRTLSNKLTQKITDAQLNDEKPSYSLRQSLSLFLGAPLDSSFTPQSIQAAQGIYAQKAQQQQNQINEPAGNKSSASKMDKFYKSYQTPNQASLQRQIDS